VDVVRRRLRAADNRRDAPWARARRRVAQIRFLYRRLWQDVSLNLVRIQGRARDVADKRVGALERTHLASRHPKKVDVELGEERVVDAVVVFIRLELQVVIEADGNEPYFADAELGDGQDGEVDIGGLVAVGDGDRHVMCRSDVLLGGDLFFLYDGHADIVTNDDVYLNDVLGLVVGQSWIIGHRRAGDVSHDLQREDPRGVAGDGVFDNRRAGSDAREGDQRDLLRTEDGGARVEWVRPLWVAERRTEN
jgi:hypothetical protein